MNGGKRPLSVLMLSCLYIAVGTIGLAYHFPGLTAFHYEDVWIELTELLALITGVFMLRGLNWARWLAIAWMAFHVAISYPVLRQIAMHSLLLGGIVWLLFRPDSRRYFASDRHGLK